ncbi:MAG: hypothetical protein ACR5K5_06805 [Wolbachia sp.]
MLASSFSREGSLLANNVDVNTIVKFTGPSISEIEELSVNGYVYFCIRSAEWQNKVDKVI